jgi:hypothetical protein
MELEGEYLFDWLVDQAQALPEHSVSPQAEGQETPDLQ